MSAAVTTVIESKKRKQDEISTMATTSSYVPVIGKSNTKAPNKKMFWQWTVDEIGQWMRGLQALFPPKPEFTAKPNETEEELEKRQAKLKEWEEFTEASTKGTQTLLTAVASATTKQTNSDWEDDEFNIMDSGFARGERVIYIPGAVLSRLGAYRPFLTQKKAK